MKYSELCKNVINTVKRASEIMLERSFTVERKSTEEDIVTSADVAVQKFLFGELGKLLPESGFLGEEKHLSDIAHEYVWVIDPIDGTTNYSRGLSECAVSVALLYNGKPVIGVVYAPFEKLLFSAVAGNGAKLNGKRISVSDKSFKSSLFCKAMSLYRKEFTTLCRDIICETYLNCNDFRRFGSCAIELCYLAAGRCDLYFEIRVFPWDYAAGCLILREAGGVLSGLNGEELKFDKPTVLVGANSVENYEKLCGIVGKYLKETPYDEEL